jgi:hypothetical protein
LGGANVNATTHTGTTVIVSGNITGGNVLSSAVVSAVGAATILSGTAVPAGGTVGAGYKLSSVANLGVFFGSGAPTLSAAKGSVCTFAAMAQQQMIACISTPMAQQHLDKRVTCGLTSFDLAQQLF